MSENMPEITPVENNEQVEEVQEESRQCPNCGSTEPLDANFCVACGYKLKFITDQSDVAPVEVKSKKESKKKVGGFSRWALWGAMLGGVAANEVGHQIGKTLTPDKQEIKQIDTQESKNSTEAVIEVSSEVKELIDKYIEAVRNGTTETWWQEHEVPLSPDSCVMILSDVIGLPNNNFEIIGDSIVYYDPAVNNFYEIKITDAYEAIGSVIKETQKEEDRLTLDLIADFENASGKKTTTDDVVNGKWSIFNHLKDSVDEKVFTKIKVDDVRDAMESIIEPITNDAKIPQRLHDLSTKPVV